ncbi:Arm DNA-binding domain-containing protein [Rodentibacter ratti]|uniref:Arm DNA-binding domain-containing protein n=1 Tax=Rodentibacter ratti TaxID=1906745 RepID=UPI0015C2D002
MRINYITKKRAEISLGSFPAVQLAEERVTCEEYRALLAQGTLFYFLGGGKSWVDP